MDTENDDGDDAAEESVSKKARYGSKGSSRCRITWKQKALAVQHYEQMVPKPTHDQLGEWCKKTFKLDQTPSKCAVGKWLKQETKAQLLHKLETEVSAHVQQQKSLYGARYPELEVALDQWFHTVQANNGVITDETIREQALKLGTSLNLVDFRASNN